MMSNMMTNHSNWKTYRKERTNLGNYDFISNPVPWPIPQVDLSVPSLKTVKTIPAAIATLRCDIKT